MNHYSSEEKNRIMRQGLKELEEQGYISFEVYDQVRDAQNQYYVDMLEKKRAELAEAEKVQKTEVQFEDAKHAEPIEFSKPKKVKKQLSPQEIRERNITWSLNLGVIMLLIGGLVLATSTWETLADWMKTGLVAAVSILFFGLAFITKRVLKIEKTAFAFHVLGSLFLPIVILSAGYFQLFGPYFSVQGEGRFLFGAVGTLAILPVYLLLASRLSSRLFIWFSYITFSVFVGFAIAAMYLPVDGFYLGIMLFNALLIVSYRYLRNDERFSWLMKDFVPYIQVNLVLSTLLMLVFYDQEVFYSFNLFLTAILYMSMIYVTNRKEYYFVFSAMLVYGVYQLIENSILDSFGSIGYALLGVVFLILPNFLSDQIPLKRIFRYMSAVVSGCAFLYISWEGILLRMNEPSFALLMAYVIIWLNFTYLSNATNQQLFKYLSPIFLFTALYELVLLGQTWIGYDTIMFPLFIGAFIVYLGLGCFLSVKFFQSIRESTRDISLAVMAGTVLFNYAEMIWWQTGIMFLLFAFIGLVGLRFEKRETFLATIPWIHALSLGLAVLVFIEEMYPDRNANQPFEAINLVASGIVLLLTSLAWKSLKRNDLSTSTFFASHLFYFVGLVLTFSFVFDHFLRSAIVLGGVGMALLLYKRLKWSALAFVVSMLTLLWYATALFAVQREWRITFEVYDTLQLSGGGAFLLVIGLLVGQKDRGLMRGYYWIGHLYIPLALLVSYLFYQEAAIWPLLLAVVIYGVSVWKAKAEWLLKTFLYAAFTSMLLTIQVILDRLDLHDFEHYSFFILSVLIGCGWFIFKGEWSRRIAYYLVPFSIIGMNAFLSAVPYEWDAFAVMIVYAVGTLVVMHKERWDVFSVVPLILVFAGVVRYGETVLDYYPFELLTFAILAIIMTVVGHVLYKSVYEKPEDKKGFGRIDWYTIVGFLGLMGMYAFTTEELWVRLLPGLLISANLYFQRNRIPYVPAKWLMFGAVVYLLQPYYTLILELDVPQLFERELFVLPWVGLAIYLKKVTAPERRVIANRIQWGVLIIVSLLLVQDGMASSTVYDAIIVGTLSLASMLGGMAYRIKSFFFVGAGVLLLNLFLQTRPFWGNMPWWVYLLIAGSILIGVASYNEWHKQKTSDGKETLITKLNKKIIQKIKAWE
ncbi:hypothetical protein [Pseudalkalibacillus sp. SCS-8]|uniref:hypothetical protein n=1 Tax=Pseudalkalibacillus nanhaiensis TaxID=3115291 RepID=UPI0032DACFAA